MSNAIIKSEPTMQLIWDLPVRLWHWLLTRSFIAAAVISLAIGEDSSLFPYHSILGLVMGLMVVLRLIWGVIGTRHARLGALAFAPSALRQTSHGSAGGLLPPPTWRMLFVWGVSNQWILFADSTLGKPFGAVDPVSQSPCADHAQLRARAVLSPFASK